MPGIIRLISKIKAPIVGVLPFLSCSPIQLLNGVAELVDDAVRLAGVATVGAFEPCKESPP